MWFNTHFKQQNVRSSGYYVTIISFILMIFRYYHVRSLSNMEVSKPCILNRLGAH